MDPVIQTGSLGKTYEMGGEQLHALQSIDLTIFPNEYLALTGPSGSGKSTLMNLLGCLDTPSDGSYHLKGQDVSQLSDEALASIRNREIGFVFQTFNLISRMTALENVSLPLIYSGLYKKEREEKAKKVLSDVGLEARIHHKPSELSGGQRQRVSTARALVNNPSIILADEPTGNLDTQTSNEIMGLFNQLYEQGQTIIMVTHEPEIAQFSRRVVQLVDGSIQSDKLQEA